MSRHNFKRPAKNKFWFFFQGFFVDHFILATADCFCNRHWKCWNQRMIQQLTSTAKGWNTLQDHYKISLFRVVPSTEIQKQMQNSFRFCVVRLKFLWAIRHWWANNVLIFGLAWWIRVWLLHTVHIYAWYCTQQRR